MQEVWFESDWISRVEPFIATFNPFLLCKSLAQAAVSREQVIGEFKVPIRPGINETGDHLAWLQVGINE